MQKIKSLAHAEDFVFLSQIRRKEFELSVFTIILLAIGSICVLCIAGIIFDVCTFKTTEYIVNSEELKKPFSFVVLSDLHGHEFGKNNKRLIKRIDLLNPDAVLIAGDLLTSSVFAKVEGIACMLRDLSSRYPVYYGMGNHEERLSRMTYRYGDKFETYRKLLKGSGVKFLANESVELNEWNIKLYGFMMSNDYYEKFHKKVLRNDYMVRKIGVPAKDKCNILIAHNPEYFEEYAKWGKSIVLSGHNHGGIIGVPFLGGLISPRFTFFPKYDGGVFKENESIMLLSRGLSTHTIPVRLLNRSELLYVKLEPERDNGAAKS